MLCRELFHAAFFWREELDSSSPRNNSRVFSSLYYSLLDGLQRSLFHSVSQILLL